MAFPTGFHQPSLFQNTHMMRNRRLCQLHALLDIARTKPGFLVNRASAFFLKRQQNPASSRVGNSMQKAIKIGSGVNHDEESTRK